MDYLCQNMRCWLTYWRQILNICWLCSKLWCTGESWVYYNDRSSTAFLAIPFVNKESLHHIGCLMQIMRHRLTYLWQSCSIFQCSIDVQAHLSSASLGVGYWDTARVFMAQMQLSQPVFAWHLIEVKAQLRSAMQSRMTFLDLYEATFDKQWLIMDV